MPVIAVDIASRVKMEGTVGKDRTGSSEGVGVADTIVVADIEGMAVAVTCGGTDEPLVGLGTVV